MGKIVPRSACSFTLTSGASEALNYGPQVLNATPWQVINLGLGGAACAVKLEFAGTYLLIGRIHFGGNFQAGDELTFGMMDQEQELEIGDIAFLKVPVGDGEWEQEFTRVYTVTSPRTVFLYANNGIGNRGGVIGLRTGIQWVRLNPA
jgi:hypothetical protein